MNELANINVETFTFLDSSWKEEIQKIKDFSYRNHPEILATRLNLVGLYSSSLIDRGNIFTHTYSHCNPLYCTGLPTSVSGRLVPK